MNRIFTCIICPVGCEIEVTTRNPFGYPDKRPDEEPVILEINGANCERGKAYVENELKNPQRIVTSSVRVSGGNMPIVSVRLSAPVPRDRMMDVIEELRHISIEAPAKIGQVVVKNILGSGSDVIVTKQVQKASPH